MTSDNVLLNDNPLSCSKSSAGTMMNLDKFLTSIGEFGKYQRMHYFLLSMCGFLSAFSAMGYVFLCAVPDHWCKSPMVFSNLSLRERKQLTLPLDDKGMFSKCLMYDFDAVNSSIYDYIENNNSRLNMNVSLLPLVACTTWEYDDTFYTETVVTKWNLVCGQEWVAASVGGSMGAGKLVFGFLSGALADRFGRKTVLVAMTSIQCVFGILSAFAPEPITFIIACALMSGASLAAYQCAFVIGLEMVGVKWRVATGTGIYLFWSVGYLFMTGTAYFIRTWWTLQIVLHAPLAIFVMLYAWITPESVRWLLRMNRTGDALAILKKMAVTNGVIWKDNDNTIADNIQVDDVTLVSLIKSKTMVLFTLTSCSLFFSCNLLFYGLSFNSSNLDGNPYVNIMLSAAVEIPAVFFMYFLLNSKLGRRGSTFATIMVSSLALLATIPIPKDLAILTTILANIGKFSITAAFAMVYIYTPEIYPTSFRSLAIGISLLVGRLGVILAPYVAMLGTMFSNYLPLVIFGVVSLAASCMTLLLPETKSVPLPDTMEDLRNLKQYTLSCKRLIHGEQNSLSRATEDVIVEEEPMLTLVSPSEDKC